MSELSVTERLARLEREVLDLRARLQALEQRIGTSAEHPADRESTRGKAVYDWQGPR